MKTYTTSELAKISGITVAQLKQWDQAGLLRPARVLRGRNSDRRYTHEQALGVMALAELKRRGVSGRRIRAASAKLPLSLTGYAYVVFDGLTMYPKGTAAEVVELLGRVQDAVHLVRVRPLVDQLQ